MISPKVSRTLERMMHFERELRWAYRLYTDAYDKDCETRRIFCLATERAFELTAEWLLRTCNLLYISKEEGLVEDKLAEILGKELAHETSRALGEKIRFGTANFSSEALLDYLSESISVFGQVEAKLKAEH